MALLAAASCVAPDRFEDRLPARWAGANAFELWARPDGEIAEALDVMVDAKLRVLRVAVLASFDPARPYADVEEPLGHWHDEVLVRIDRLLFEAEQRRIRVMILLRDGRNRNDAYAKRHPGATFYTDSAARAAYRRRIEHVLNYRGEHTGRTWRELGPVLHAWDVGNRADWRAAPDWCEDMAGYVKMLAPRHKAAVGGIELVSIGESSGDLIRESPSVDYWGYEVDPKEPLEQAAAALAARVTPRKRSWFLADFSAPRSDLARQRKVFEGAIRVAEVYKVPWLFTSLGRDRHEASTDLWPGDLSFDAIVAPAAAK